MPLIFPNMSDVVRKQIAAYQENFILHGNTPKGTFQNNQITQFERFHQIIKPLIGIKKEGFSICDIGAGICDLHQFLIEQNINHQYTAIEIVPEMVEASKARFPDISVLNVDFLQEKEVPEYDFVVLSGVFNLPGEVSKEDWETFVFQMIEKMFKCARLGISFNTLTTYSTFYSPELYYANPLEIIPFIQNKLSRFYLFNSSYALFEHTFTVFKQEAIEPIYPNIAFDKYFKRNK